MKGSKNRLHVGGGGDENLPKSSLTIAHETARTGFVMKYAVKVNVILKVAQQESTGCVRTHVLTQGKVYCTFCGYAVRTVRTHTAQYRHFAYCAYASAYCFLLQQTFKGTCYKRKFCQKNQGVYDSP